MNTLFRAERIRRIIDDLQRLIYDSSTSVPLRWLPGYYAAPADAASALPDAAPFESNQIWGGRNTYAWFHGEAELPAAQPGRRAELLVCTADGESAETDRLSGFVNGPVARWDLMNPQFMLFVNGELVQGMDVHHQAAVLPADGRVAVDLQGYAGMTDRRCVLRVSVAVAHTDVRALYYDLLTALEAAETLDENDPARLSLLNSLNEACSRLDLRAPYSPAFENGLREAAALLSESVYTGSGSDVTAVCVGHTHIDVAWLWDHQQTRLKTQRSLSSVLRLMDEYPGFTFFQSTPQLFRWLRQDNPALYEGIRRRVAEGRFEVGGAMWLEADCNIPSGESLIRQLVYGKRFFRSEFGTECEVLWLPDVFGYSAALPQILRQTGIHTFVTTKISWNMLNKMPYDTFRWQGIDGSGVLTYFITTTDPKQEDGSFGTTYNGMLHPAAIMGGWKRYQQKELNRSILVAYGYGDGGGGPDDAMLQKGVRLQRGIAGFPRVELGHVRPFFRALHAKVDNSKYLPVWVGELYLELHQGAYTSAALMKRNNRLAERELFAAEMLQTAAALRGRPYAAGRLHAAWETLLLNQFHDTLPGSCIGKVYQDARQQFAELFSLTGACKREAARALWGEGDRLVAWNDRAFPRADLLLLPGDRRIAGHPYQPTPEGNLCYTPEIPPMGWAPLQTETTPADPGAAAAPGKAQALQTRFFTIACNEYGELTRMYDHTANREVLPKGERANVLMAFDDRPYHWDTWNVDMYYEEKQYPVNGAVTVSPVVSGPVFEALFVEKRFGRSVFRQEIRAYHDIPRIDFITHVDWHEDATLLKVAFPVDLNADFATFDIQCGSVRRPTHRNTSWDTARYEVCAHRWADISEGDYGVSLLNDCKYGCDAQGNVLRLTLLKAGMSPDDTIDRGVHIFTYSLFPHAGPCGAATNEMADRLNHPLRSAWAGNDVSKTSLLTLHSPNIAVDAIKPTEDGDGWLLVRMHEQGNTHARATLTAGFPVEAAMACDLMEENRQPLPIAENGVALSFHPFEIKTVLLKPGAPLTLEGLQ
ncbi:MAG: glycoside hydrolase family 38 C-terminal domain-containing protein [Eubacteriales bacterium]|nr:glycoside hydrolase family 38 C-terminal domain-containing protein [Eubacteriales bacterium]